MNICPTCGQAIKKEGLGAIIIKYRLKANLDQTELAKKIGLSRTSVTNLEGNRQTLTLDVMQKLTETLAIPPEEWIPVLFPKTETGDEG